MVAKSGYVRRFTRDTRSIWLNDSGWRATLVLLCSCLGFAAAAVPSDDWWARKVRRLVRWPICSVADGWKSTQVLFNTDRSERRTWKWFQVRDKPTVGKSGQEEVTTATTELRCPALRHAKCKTKAPCWAKWREWANMKREEKRDAARRRMEKCQLSRRVVQRRLPHCNNNNHGCKHVMQWWVNDAKS